MKLFFIHGRSQGGKTSVGLKKEWRAALQEGLDAAHLKLPASFDLETDITVPFYGDTLDEFVADFGLPLLSKVTAKGVENGDDFLEFQRSALNDLLDNAKVSQAKREEATDVALKKKGVQNWLIVRQLAKLFDSEFGDVTSAAIAALLRDVYLYVDRKSVSRAVNRLIAQELTDEPTVVVSHSLGTVVAYKLLLEGKGRWNVPLLITLVIPLGINAIKDKFIPLLNVANVGRWYNAYDRKDIVALRALDKKTFLHNPLIEDFGHIKNKTDNHHGISGYLNDPEVARRIEKALRGQ